MSFEPINIFSHRIDPRGVAELLRAAGAALEVAGPDDDWSQIVVVFAKRELIRKARVLTFGHDADYYDSLDWPKQVAGTTCGVNCSVDAIFHEHDVPQAWQEFVQLNAEMSARAPPITGKNSPLVLFHLADAGSRW